MFLKEGILKQTISNMHCHIIMIMQFELTFWKQNGSNFYNPLGILTCVWEYVQSYIWLRLEFVNGQIWYP